MEKTVETLVGRDNIGELSVSSRCLGLHSVCSRYVSEIIQYWRIEMNGYSLTADIALVRGKEDRLSRMAKSSIQKGIKIYIHAVSREVSGLVII